MQKSELLKRLTTAAKKLSDDDLRTITEAAEALAGLGRKFSYEEFSAALKFDAPLAKQAWNALFRQLFIEKPVECHTISDEQIPLVYARQIKERPHQMSAKTWSAIKRWLDSL